MTDLTVSGSDLSGRPPAPEGVARLLAPRTDPGLSAHLARFGPAPGDVDVIAEVDRSGLRGRGGAAFPTAVKMAAVARGRRPVVVANGTEGEPLSAKDRVLLTRNPHLVLDGLAAAAAAVGARRTIIALDRSQTATATTVQTALAERPDGPRVELVETPSRYVAGQETALVSWINGGEARPKFGIRPYEDGVGHRPTLVDNVETLAHVGLIARFGADWFRLLGPVDEPGSMLVTLTGGADRPGVYEVPVATSLHDLLARAGARSPRAVLVGGYFGTWIERRRITDVSLCTQGLAGVAARPGCGVIVALPENACALSEVAAVAKWYAAQSAGQCGACAFGLPDIARAVDGILHGDPEAEAAARRWTAMVRGRGACQLPDGAAAFVDSALEAFADEVSDHQRGCCRRAPTGFLPVPLPGGWR